MRRLASFFLALGATIGVVGVAGLAIGFEPSRLPPALVDISVYKLVFVAAAAVLAAGAVLLRAERRYRSRNDAAATGAAAVGAGDPADDLRRARDARARESESR